MAKSIRFTDEQHEELVKLARLCGFTVKRGPFSELGKFVMSAAETKAALHRAKLGLGEQRRPVDGPR